MKKAMAWVLILALAVSLAGCTAGAGQNLADNAADGTAAAAEGNPADASGSADEPDSDWAYVKTKGTLIVGITEYEPMDYLDSDGSWVGFDADLARMVGEKLGVRVEFQLIEWGQKYFELNSRNIDAIWNGMTITEEVLANTSCSDPYVRNAQVLVMDAGAVGQYGDAASLAGLTFAVEDESAGEKALQEAGITGYIEVLDQATALMEVAAGTADACVIDLTMANAMTGPGTSYANLGKGLELTSEVYGIGFRKGSDLTSKVNELLKELSADGSLAALAEKYSLTLAAES